MRSFDFVLATTDAQIADAQRIRWLVYGEEERMLGAPVANQALESTDFRLVDPCDGYPGTAHVLVYDGALPVGTLRLTALTDPDSAAQGGSPIDAPFAVEGLPRGSRMAVVARFCILRRYRGTRVAGTLYKGLTVESHRRGITHLLAVANAETDCPQDAALAYRVAEAKGLSSGALRARAPASACPAAPCRRHIYNPAQREQGARGTLAGLPLPRTLSLFAKRMGARYAGPPVYDPTLRIFALPLVAKPPAL